MPAPVYSLRTLTPLNGDTTGDYSLLKGGGLLIDGAGNLVGATSQGGANGFGTVFEIAPGGTTPIVVAPFTAASGYNIYTPSSLAADADGDLYGEQYFGGTDGAAGYGTVFEIVNTGTRAAPVYSSAPTALASFDGQETRYGTGGLFVDGAGNLVGMTEIGGASDLGTVFELPNAGTAAAPSYTGQVTTLASFDGLNGREPGFNGRLIADAAGDLIGTVQAGGPSNDGTVFEIVNTGTVGAPVYAASATVLASFAGTGGTGGTGGPDGSRPYGSVVADANGNLFGTTYAGGANRSGTVYEIANTGTKSAPAYAAGATTLASFGGFGAGSPYGALLVDKAGNLYGTASFGGAGGAVYELANTGTVAAPRYAAAPTVLASLGEAYGSNPTSDLAVDAAGDLFATTTTDGANDGGTVIELAAAPAPTITGTTASHFTAAESPVAPFETAAVNDPTAGAIDTLTIVLTGRGGTLRDGPSFIGTSTLASTGPGTYTLTGAAGDITAELQALSFTPTAGAPGTTTTTNFALSDATSANGFVVATDDTTTVTDTAAPPPPAGEAVSIAPAVSFRNGVFVLSGTATSPVGVSAVEISAVLNGGARVDLGAAAVNADGTFSFADLVGPNQQTYFEATLTDGTGARTVSADPGFSLTGGFGPAGRVGRQDSFSPDALVSTSLFRPNGLRSVDVRAAGQTVDLQLFDVVANHREGATRFVFGPGDGLDVIGGFKVGGADHDVLELPASDFRTIADILRNTGDVNGSAFITDPKTGDAVRLAGVTTAELKAHPRDLALGL